MPFAVAMSGAVFAALGLAAVMPAVGAGSSSSLENCNGKIKVEGKNLGAKFPKDSAASTSITNATITGCDMEIKANSASSDNFNVDNSNWTLQGNVRIHAIQQQLRINSDQAIVKFADSEIQLITITGNPTEFEQKKPDGQVTRGHARQMVYEAGPGIVRMVDDAWLSDGNGKTLESPALWYDIRKAEMGYSSDGSGKANSSAGNSSGDGQHVIITIDPKAAKAKKEEEKKTAPAPSSSPSPGTNPAPTPTKP